MLKRGLIMCVACAPLVLVFGCPTVLPPAGCTADADCTGDEVCVSGSCVECGVDEDCAADLLCSAGNTCVECEADEDCAIDFVCTDNACVAGPECVVDEDCDAGDVCTDDACVAGPECVIDEDCAVDFVCTEGACVAGPECVVDEDCAEGEVCTDGACVAGGGGADAAAGEAFFMTNGCMGCHGADATGGIGPNIQTATAADVFDHLSGVKSHPITVPNVTLEDAENVAAWLNSL